MGYADALLLTIYVVAFAVPPPEAQTSAQLAVLNKWHTQAHNLSNSATQAVLTELDSSHFRQEIAKLGFGNKSASDLLKWFQSELRVLPIITTLRFENWWNIVQQDYLAQHWELQVAGIGKGTKVMNVAEVKLMKFPDFAAFLKPTLKEAQDRPQYASVNLWRRSTGNPKFGDTTFILRPHYKKWTILAPCDTGRYVAACNVTAVAPDTVSHADPHNDDCRAWRYRDFGSLSDFNHLVLEHHVYYRYSLGQLFLRMANLITANNHDYEFWEADFTGTYYLPEMLHCTIATFDTLFGNANGTKLQTWHRSTGLRPLVWTNSNYTDDSMVIDVSVQHFTGLQVAAVDTLDFDHLWQAHSTWSNFVSIMTKFYVRYLFSNDLNVTCPQQLKTCPANYVCEFLFIAHGGECLWTVAVAKY